ncbi:MAG: Periplasmic serine protease, family [Gammaproteobacteria bacterium]|jgi:serine protease SohB|nr:Periplasmic serine protease, family [Gammaproteobacteria bacterium]
MLPEYFFFLAKIVTVVVAVLILLVGVVAIVTKGKNDAKDTLRINKINDRLDKITEKLRKEVLSKGVLKETYKAEKAGKKARKSAKKEELSTKDGEKIAKKRLFVLNFSGDVRASAVSSLREEITAILTIATPDDEVVVRLESPGGMVHAYGLAASQLKRIRDRGVPLTVIVDKVAASGGYMMACVANRIIAAPFAVIGSIGVVAQIPNFNRLLKKKEVDFEQITAGQYKRTLTMFGENTKKDREKFQSEINEIHELFKAFVVENRPSLNMDEVATGEHWFGTDALKRKLIDEMMTSDDYLLTASKDAEIFEIKYVIPKKSFIEKFSYGAQSAWDQLWQRF